jgi:gentisate 1,2-dioxygenase
MAAAGEPPDDPSPGDSASRGPRFLDVSGAPPEALDPWPPVIFRAEMIQAEIDRLASLPPPADGRRSALLAHPRSERPGLGLAPGIRVSLQVLLPGERTAPVRHNSTHVDFCIQGEGRARIGDHKVDFSRYDAWNTPSYRTYEYENRGEAIQVRLTYSNAPLLEKLHVHIVETGDFDDDAGSRVDDAAGENPYGVIDIGRDGAMLMPYELLVDPPVVDSRPLHWPWAEVKARLDALERLGAEYTGRRLYLLYNPATGRTNGTTPSLFATITLRPPGIVDRPHRHVSAAINYFFAGSGYSRVGGRRYEWSSGDLMLTAPGWMIHHHASGDQPVYELTIQDQPLNIAMESLLWQEDLKHPPILLGSQPGFTTNRGMTS